MEEITTSRFYSVNFLATCWYLDIENWNSEFELAPYSRDINCTLKIVLEMFSRRIAVPVLQFSYPSHFRAFTEQMRVWVLNSNVSEQQYPPPISRSFHQFWYTKPWVATYPEFFCPGYVGPRNIPRILLMAFRPRQVEGICDLILLHDVRRVPFGLIRHSPSQLFLANSAPSRFFSPILFKRFNWILFRKDKFSRIHLRCMYICRLLVEFLRNSFTLYPM